MHSSSRVRIVAAILSGPSQITSNKIDSCNARILSTCISRLWIQKTNDHVNLFTTFDYKLLDQSAGEIVDTALRTGARVAGPIPLPTDKHRYTLIRGPHVDKDSREHFEMRVHKRLIDIVNPNAKTIDSLQRIELPAGVDIEIKIQNA